MALARSWSVALRGVEGQVVEIDIFGDRMAGEVDQDVVGSGDALAIAGEVAGPGLFYAAAPGGVVA